MSRRPVERGRCPVCWGACAISFDSAPSGKWRVRGASYGPGLLITSIVIGYRQHRRWLNVQEVRA